MATAADTVLSTEDWVSAVLASSPLAINEDDEDSDLDEWAKDNAQLEAQLFSPISA